MNTTAQTSYAIAQQKVSHDLTKQEIGYLALMWSLLAINVMLITFINASLTHCM